MGGKNGIVLPTWKLVINLQKWRLTTSSEDIKREDIKREEMVSNW